MKIKNPRKKLEAQRERRHKRQRAKIFGTKERPRISVFRSNKHIYCQLVDDTKGHTIVSAKDTEIEDKEKKGKKPVEIAFLVGELLAKKAINQGIEKVVFDKGWYKYHGRVRALADGARKGGLKF